MNRPNIFVVVVHNIGRHVGCYDVASPTLNLDTFAVGLLCLTQAYRGSVARSQSRGCGTTGQYAHVSGGVDLTHMGCPQRDGCPPR